MSEWMPIETAPKDGTWILAYGNGADAVAWPPSKPLEKYFQCVRWHDYEVETYEPANDGLYRRVMRRELGSWRGAPLSFFTPTHWMPLPKAPA